MDLLFLAIFVIQENGITPEGQTSEVPFLVQLLSSPELREGERCECKQIFNTELLLENQKLFLDNTMEECQLLEI